ncbi:MAG: hypothetical protein HQL40_00525 [Alphaproteobacteria bacterium]|nr:hypothetical protein [Alphaproteobacteria bacterium]
MLDPFATLGTVPRAAAKPLAALLGVPEDLLPIGGDAVGGLAGAIDVSPAGTSPFLGAVRLLGDTRRAALADAVAQAIGLLTGEVPEAADGSPTTPRLGEIALEASRGIAAAGGHLVGGQPLPGAGQAAAALGGALAGVLGRADWGLADAAALLGASEVAEWGMLADCRNAQP